MNTAEKIRLPDDCTVGYIIESVLGVPLTRSNLFHSHLENLQQVPQSDINKQVRSFCTRTVITLRKLWSVFAASCFATVLMFLCPFTDHSQLWHV